MNHLHLANVQAHSDMVMLKELLKRFSATDFSVSVDHFSSQSVIRFTIDQHNYQLRVPVGTSYDLLGYYLKEQLPEIFL